MRNLLIIFLIFLKVLGYTQNQNSLHLGGGIGYNAYANEFIESHLETQLFLTAYHNKLTGEFNYAIVPFSDFGVKNKIMIMAGRTSNPTKRFNGHFLIGLGYLFGTKYKKYGDANNNGQFYPNQIGFNFKIGTVYKIRPESNFFFVASIYCQFEKIVLNHRFQPSNTFPIPSVILGLRYLIKS